MTSEQVFLVAIEGQKLLEEIAVEVHYAAAFFFTLELRNVARVETRRCLILWMVMACTTLAELIVLRVLLFCKVAVLFCATLCPRF